VHPSALFIRRPIATSLLMAAIAMFGIVAYRALPVSDLPNVDYPTLVVNAGLSGADPGTMASAVATPLERQFTMIAGLDEMTSSSSMGGSSVTMQFDLARDIDSAAVDVQTAIAAVMPLLPPGMPSPPSFRKYNPADSPVMFLGLTTNTLPMSALDDYAEALIAPRVSMVPGVAQVTVWGSAKYAVRVRVDPDKLRAQQIGLDEVSAALSNWNVNLPTGSLNAPNLSYSIRASGQLSNAAGFRPLVVAWRGGAPVRLDQVADVIDSVEQDKNDSWLYTKENGRQRAINLAVMRQPGSNTIEVTDTIRQLLPGFQSQLPPSVHLTIRGDRSKNIRAAFKDIQTTMLLTLALVVGVIFLFLRNTSATMIPALALPFSIVGTFAVMSLLDFTLDNLSMMALILSVGFVVDDAIVMLENIVRHMEMGEAPYEAALNGSKEIGFTIVTMTLSLAAVFIPILFMAGILGRLFREFAVTICTAILISGVVSITLTPMLASRFLRGHIGESRSRLSRLIGLGFDRLKGGYQRSLRVVLRHRFAMLVVFFGVLAATVFMFSVVPKGFIPDQDNDQISVSIRAAQGTSYYQMVTYVRRVADIIQHDPNVDSFMINVGGGGGGGVTSSRLSVQLLPRAQRTLTAQQIIQQLRPKVSRFPGFNVFLTLPAAIQIGGRQSSSSYTISVQALDTKDLYTWAPRLEAEIAGLPEVQDVVSDMEMKTPRVNLVIDRDKAATMRLNASQIESSLYDGFGPVWASTIYGAQAQYKVLLELDPKYQANADSLEKIGFKSASGALVPLQAVVRFKEDVGPQTINHSGQLPSVTISFNLKPGVALGSAVDTIQARARQILPSNVTTSFQGSAKVFQSSLTNLGLLLTVAILVVFIVLGILYESYVHPLTILSGLPSAGLGALLTLWLLGIDLNIYSFVGLIMLIGIVKKNAIMQIDFALEAERNEGKSPAEAIYEGCLIRFRPIMMTTMAALLGAVPIALGFGSGGEARRPLGIAVVGGLMVSQLMTLYLTPVIYTYMAGLFTGRKAVRATTENIGSV
jgi:HAE1 family hydrophobic/amphiphilic exporter-1